MRMIPLLAVFVPLAAFAAEKTPDGQALGLANPASVHCADLGGTLEMREEANGTVGYCHLPDGRVVEEWTLFREDAATDEAAPAK